MTKKEIANILKTLRNNAGFSQRKAAESIGRKQQTLASWETAQSQPDANTLFVLCKLYGVSVDQAFGFEKNIDYNKLTKIDNEIIKNLALVNDEAKQKLLTYIEDLCSIEKYKKNNQSTSSINEEAKLA